ncbi:transglutaminase family protein [Shimia thalassica]|uniref:transglutaminase-like domain-containing protein n=1 Tax=Shimia thalassica TaxID=1715693 RepID=UPI002733098A|nr:transglutaminase family protein [Shimia thalassica]MDP2520590.1 transglutaminase family protein [Shimia thalassica]MDP2582034.1 transglutaminase family protein [Shimia thalassica]
MTIAEPLLAPTPILNFDHPSIARLVKDRGWNNLSTQDRIGAVYDFVRNEIAFGYNRSDDISATDVLADGFGQCNTKGTLLMALLRAVGVRSRFHGFTIHKELQRGVVPELVYPIAPKEIIHSWVEVETEKGWINLEGFILDAPFLSALQSTFPTSSSLCGYGAGTDCLAAPPVEWTGGNTYIQKTGIVQDFGTYDAPDDFYANHHQAFGIVRGLLYRLVIRHWMNARVRGIRAGNVPHIPGLTPPNHQHQETRHAS